MHATDCESKRRGRNKTSWKRTFERVIERSDVDRAQLTAEKKKCTSGESEGGLSNTESAEHTEEVAEGGKGYAGPYKGLAAALFCGFFILARARRAPRKRIPHKALYCAKLNTSAKYALKGTYLRLSLSLILPLYLSFLCPRDA